MPPASEDKTMHKLPATDRTFLRSQISDPFGPADWYPNDHPPMPDIVAKGRMSPGKTANESARACGLCHYPNGKGRAENSSVSGLPVSYFIQQMNDFRNDTRKSSEPRKANAIVMVNIAKAMTEQEIKEAAEYFAAIKWTTPYIRVVETNTVPKTRVTAGVHHILEGAAAGTEPIGQRIIEGGACPGGQHQEGRGIGQDGREREDRGLRQLPRRRPAGSGPGASYCGSFSQHAREADVGHEAGHPQGNVGRPDEAGRAQPDQ
jgi:cytochrome c553